MAESIENLLERSGAILRGHFLLTSGRHSDTYFEKFRILEQPAVLSELCRLLCERFEGQQIDLVAGPTTGGIIIAYEVARRLGCKALYVESEDGTKKLRRGATVPAGARVLIVDDVLTTGKSIFEVIEVVRSAGGLPVGVGVLIDRSEERLDFGCSLERSFRVEAKSYAPDDVPGWLSDVPITKPGTRVGV